MKNKFDVIFIGTFYVGSLLDKILQSGIGLANHNFEISLISGLEMHDNIRLHCISLPLIPSYPYHFKYPYTKREYHMHDNVVMESIPFINLPLVKELSAILACVLNLFKYILSSDNKKINLIISTPDFRAQIAARFVSLFFRKKISVTTIIPDIPNAKEEFYQRSFLKSKALRLLSKLSLYLIAKGNGVVLLTKHMIDFFPRCTKYIIMEGLINTQINYSVSKTCSTNNEIILYSGSIESLYGIRDLVDAFKLITNTNIELWICGSGDSQSYIEAAAKIDSRIKFYGLVDGETARKLQREATILVNPRTSRGEYTKYSFPSKTLEYMLSGKSVVMHKLPGVPDEYYEYVFSPVEESILSLKECIEGVLSMNPSYRKNKAVAGRNFVLSNKNAQKQVSRIIDFIKSY